MDLPAGTRLDDRADRLPVVFRTRELEAQPVMSRGLVVAQQQRSATSLREDDVEVAIAIDVGEG